METVQVGWRLDRDIVEQVQRLAQEEERSIGVVVRRLLKAAMSTPSSNGSPPSHICNTYIPPSLTPTPNNIMVEVMPREARQKRGTRLPPDFLPDQGGQELALSLGLDLQATLDHFRDFWTAKPGQGGVKLDWQATWRNWCRNTRGRGGAATRATGLEGFYND